MLEVHAVDDGGWAIVGGAKAETFDTLDEALAVYLGQCGATVKTAKLRDPDTRELNGAWRWLPACEQEPEPIKGARIDGEALREAAVSLNTRATPVAIDGGPTPPGMLPSEVHGTPMTGGATLANGWCHTAAIIVDRSGNVELYLWTEVVPVVAREIDAGRLGGGSVDLRYKTLDGDAPRGVVLGSFALTNDPAVTTLEPANAPRSADGLMSAVRTCRFDGRVIRAANFAPRTGGPMLPKNKPALRGPAMDAENKIFALFGIDPNDDDADCDLSDAIWSIRQAADAEEAIAAIMGGKPLEPAEPTATAEAAAAVPAPKATYASAAFRASLRALAPLVIARDAKGLAAALRADAGVPNAPMTADQSTALLGQITTVLATIFDKPDATPAQLFDLLNASADKIKGALAATAEPPKDGNGASPPKPVQASAQLRADATAEKVGLIARAETAEAKNAELETRLAKLEANETKRALADQIDEAFRKAARTIKASDRDELVTDITPLDEAGRARSISRAVKAAGIAPITEDVMGGPGALSRSGSQTGGGTGEPGTFDSSEQLVKIARTEFLPGLETANATLPRMKQQPKHVLVARAQKLAREKYPHLAETVTTDAA